MDILQSTHKNPVALSLPDMYALLLKFTSAETPKIGDRGTQWKMKVVSYAAIDKIIFNCISYHKKAQYYAESDGPTFDFILSLHNYTSQSKFASRPVELVLSNIPLYHETTD
jgi:hypothetical protein